MIASPYRIMWIIVLFDLPTDSPEARREYREFRESLMEDGFGMMQFSVYARCVPSEEKATVHVARVRKNLPPEGEVRVLLMTDKQLSRMQIFLGKQRQKAESAPAQLEFF